MYKSSSQGKGKDVQVDFKNQDTFYYTYVNVITFTGNNLRSKNLVEYMFRIFYYYQDFVLPLQYLVPHSQHSIFPFSSILLHSHIHRSNKKYYFWTLYDSFQLTSSFVKWIVKFQCFIRSSSWYILWWFCETLLLPLSSPQLLEIRNRSYAPWVIYKHILSNRITRVKTREDTS